MSNAVSALPGATYAGYVQVEEVGLQGMITLRGDLTSDALARAVKAAVGCAVPEKRMITVQKGKGAAWMSPDELLLLLPYGGGEAALVKLQKSLGKTHALAVNVSDARAVFRLTGAGVREVVAKLSPVDMAALQAGEIRRTRLAQVPAAFWMSGKDEVTLVAFRSVAGYVFELLKTAATPGGEVGYFQAG